MITTTLTGFDSDEIDKLLAPAEDDTDAPDPVIKDSLTTRTTAQEQFPYRETCPRMSNYCDKNLRGYSIGSPWHGVINEAFSIEEQLTASLELCLQLRAVAEELADDYGNHSCLCSSVIWNYKECDCLFGKILQRLKALNKITL